MFPWLIFIFLSACGRSPAPAVSVAPPSSETAASPSAPARAEMPEVRFAVVPLEALGAYRVDLHWTAPSGRREFWVERRRGFEKRVIANLEGVLQWSDTEVWPGQTFAYSVTAREEDSSWELGTVEVKIPVDKTLGTGEHVWDFDVPMGRLHLEKGAVIRLGERDLDLDLLELRSEGGRIETWPTGSLAAADGARGGRIRIRAVAAQGAIDLISRGQNGAAGSAGAEGPPGNPGAPGQVAAYEMDFQRLNLIQRRILPGLERDAYVIKSAAIPPGAGRDGGTGGNGKDGWRGGDSGGVRLEIQNAGPFLPTLISEGGLGGAGGAGGRGGPGGASGLWQGNDGGLPAKYQPRYEPPAPGKAGAAGLDGKPGTAGKAGPICFRVAGKPVRGCD